MHPAYTIIMSIEATVTVWKENIHSAVDRSFTVRGKVRDQMASDGSNSHSQSNTNTNDKKKQRVVDAQREAEEGRRRREMEASRHLLYYYAPRPAPPVEVLPVEKS